MKYAVNSKEMKKIDEYSVEVCSIPALDLMERAANQVVDVMKEKLDKADRILAVCGPGNNGGDGVAAGRILYLQGYHVAILFIGEEEKATKATKIQLEKAKKLGVPFENSNKLTEYNIIIDALLGVGLSRDITGTYEAIIRSINEMDSTVYAVDIPSGISCDYGKVMNVAVRSDYTITFGHQKLGLVLYPGAEYAGSITIADIGFGVEAIDKVKPEFIYYERSDIRHLPKRYNYSNKGTYGKVLVVAGSKGMSGAAYFSAKAAYRTGAGLVKILTSEENRIILQSLLPEALYSAYDNSKLCEKEQQEQLLKEIKWADTIVIGPGIGLSSMAKRLVNTVITTANVPVIIDADAITILSNRLNEEELLIKDQYLSEEIEKNRVDLRLHARLKYLESILPNETILTPHLMELSRLLDIPITEITNNLVDTAYQCSYNNKLIYALKDARTIVAHQENKYINVSGNNGMATGGSGDVLTGIIASLVAQGMDSFKGTCLAVYLHGLAGDVAAEEKGKYSMMASDILNSIEKVINKKASDKL